MAKKTIARRKTTAKNAGENEQRWTAAVSASGLLAVVRGSSAVRIVDVHSGAVRGEHVFAGGAAVHSLCWASDESAVAAVLASGAVAVYSPARNAVVATLATQAAVDVACAGDHVFTLDAAGVVEQWAHNGTVPVRRVATGLAGARRLLVDAAGARVVVASHRAEVWDFDGGRVRACGGGHAAPVHSMCWANSDESAVATAAAGDRTVLVWPATTAGGNDDGPHVLAAGADVESIDAGADGSVVAVCADGSVSAWFGPLRAPSSLASGGGDVGRAPDTVIRITDGGSGVRVARLLRTAGDEAKCLLVRGSPMAPACEVVALADRDGRFAAAVELSRPPAAALSAAQSVSAQAYSESDALIGSNEISADQQQQQPATPSLAERMGSLSVASSSAETAALRQLPAGTLVRVLVQGLHTGDARLLDSVLDSAARALVVRDTVLALPPAYVVPLLQQLLARFHSTPARAARLLPWLRATLAMHSAYLVAVPALVPQLAGFCRAIDARLDSHARLLRLSGRLELAAANARAASATAATARAKDCAAGNMQPINVYTEADDDCDGDDDDAAMTPTPVWQAEESTDDESGDDDDAMSAAAAGERGQWSDDDDDESAEGSEEDEDAEDDDDSASSSSDDL
ncbi:Small subunit (SSU) processome component [Coemansia sp. RSA 2424]|nr:Small subunit (SSU) processome component [Coemansia sp. RSA 2424]